MARFRLKPSNKAKLLFDGDLEGLEVTVTLNVPVRILYLSEDERLYETIINCVKDWNMADEHGNAIPCTEEEIANLPIHIAIQISSRIVQEVMALTSDPLGRAM